MNGLAHLRDAAEQVRANLVALELDPRRRLLSESALEGLSAKRRSQVGALVDELWRGQQELEAVLTGVPVDPPSGTPS